MEDEKKDFLTKTTIWQDYEKGVEYCKKKNMYADVDKFWNFFHGKQWENAKLGDIQPVVINIIKPIVKYKTGVLNQSSYRVMLSPDYLETNPKDANALCELLSKHIDRIFENEGLDSVLRQAIQDSSVTSEGILYSYFDNARQAVKTELVDKNNILLGNEAEEDIQNQPYIIVSFRRPVEDIKEEATFNKMKKEDIDNIMKDNEIEEQAGHKETDEEITPMCLVLLKMYKKENEQGIKTVHFRKCTKYSNITEEKDTGLELYPVCHFVWESEKGNARGIGEVEANVPNQIEINKTQMRRIISVRSTAYPKTIYNKNYIKDISSLSKAGAEIGVEGSGVDDVRNTIGYLNPAPMGADSKYLLEELINYTQELAGAGDNASGNVDPTKTSAKAIIAVQQAQQQPLNEQKIKYEKFLEDLARIYLNMFQVYMINGLAIPVEEEVQYQDETGMIRTETQTRYEQVTADVLQTLKSNVRVEITSKNAYDKYAVEQSLENLFVTKNITFEEYVHSLNYDSSMPKTKLEEIIKKREQEKQNIQQMQNIANAQMSRIQQLMGQMQNQESVNNISAMQEQGQAQIRQFNRALGG